MSRIEPKPLFSPFHQTVYRWKLKRALKSRKASRPDVVADSRLILVTSSDPKLATKELRFTRANFYGSEYHSVVCLTPTVSWNELSDLPANWTSITYGIEQVTRFGFPAQSFMDQVQRSHGSVSVLLSLQDDPYAETLFAYSRSQQHVAFHKNELHDLTSLQVSPRNREDLNPALHNLFASIQTFLPHAKEPDVPVETI